MSENTKEYKFYENYYSVFTEKEQAILKKIEDPEGPMSIVVNRVNGKTAGPTDIRATKSRKYNKYLGIPNYNKYEKEQAKGFFLTEQSNTVIKETKTMDLNQEVDLAHWNMIKFNPAVVFSSSAIFSDDALWYVEIPELESNKVVDKERLVVEAKQFIFNDNKEELTYRALLLGLDMEGDSLSAIQELLLKTANTKPQKIIDLYKGNLMSVRLLLKKALKRNLVTQKEGMYYYGIHTLGSNEERSLAYLQHKENKHLLEKMEEEYDLLDGDAKSKGIKSKVTNENKDIPSVSQEEIDAFIVKDKFDDYSKDELKLIKLVLLKEVAKTLGAPSEEVDDLGLKADIFEVILKYK